MIKQCFALEYQEDGEWKIAILLIDTREKIEADLPKFAKRVGVDEKDVRMRWIWTIAEANKLREDGIPAFGETGEDVAWLG